MSSFLDPLPRVIAHRGDSHNHPENTVPAFISALKMGIDVIETDVHLTKDNQIVIWHDPTLERNTNGHGKIEDYTLAELKTFDAGYMFSPDGGITYPYRGTGVVMATLQEALEACPTVRFNVDLKTKDRRIVSEFVHVVTAKQARLRVLCASFHKSNLDLIRKTDPDILTSLTTIEVLPLLLKQKMGLLGSASKQKRKMIFQVPVRQWGIEVITSRFIEEFHRLGAIIQVWTINEEEEMRRLFAMGVDSIMTDNPALALEVASQMGLIN